MRPRIGEQLPSFSRRTTLETWNRFAAVNDEFVAVHMDDDAGHEAGNPQGAFGMGNLRLSYLMNMLRAWTEDAGEIRSVEVRYRERNQKGDVLTTVGTVRDVEEIDGALLAHVDVDVLDQHGRSTAPGVATVAFALSDL